jgi:RNA-directed DNA polymerase
VLALVTAFLKAGILTELGRREETITGTPQGGILSPLLANIALSALDEHFAHAWAAMGTGIQRHRRRLRGDATYRLIRYADDFIICVAGRRQHAEQLVVETERVIAPLGWRSRARRPTSPISMRGLTSSAGASSAGAGSPAAR